MSWAMAATFLIPSAAAIASFLSAGRKSQLIIGMTAALATSGAVGTLAADVLRSGPQYMAAGGWAAPLGITMRCDGFSLLMLLLAAAINFPASFYAMSYFSAEQKRSERTRLFWPLWFLLWGGLNCLFLSGDIFNMYLLLEFILLCGVALASLAGSRAAFISAFRYLIAATAAALFYLLGVALLYSDYSTLDLVALRAARPSGFLPLLALGLMAGGLSLKSALFPFHFWLPPAHSTAPAPVSAVLSALVVKAAFYVMLRIWTEVFPGTPSPLPELAALLGSAAVLWGSWQALKQQRLKFLIAYSTVAQMGYLFLLFPTASEDGKAFAAVTYQMISHGLAKAAMFLAAGAIQKATGTDLIERTRGGFQKAPLAVLAIIIAGASLAGISPGGGAKGKLLGIALESGQWWWGVPIVAGMPLAAAYTFKAVAVTFGRANDGASTESWRALEAIALALSILAIGLSFFSDVVLSTLEIRSAG
jgi:multicomponent Na+:H+ antiporter subunit D